MLLFSNNNPDQLYKHSITVIPVEACLARPTIVTKRESYAPRSSGIISYVPGPYGIFYLAIDRPNDNKFRSMNVEEVKILLSRSCQYFASKTYCYSAP